MGGGRLREVVGHGGSAVWALESYNVLLLFISLC